MAKHASFMKDIQNQYDNRRINIKKVGIKGVTYPITVLDKAHQEQKTIARVSMYVNLPHHFKGTHMSRFVEILEGFHVRFNLRAFQHILEEMKRRLDAEAAHVEMAFPYFFAPTNRHDARFSRYDCRLYGSLDDKLDLRIEVDVPVPAFPEGGERSKLDCLKQCLWGEATVSVRMRTFMWIEDLIDLIETGLRQTEEGSNSIVDRCRAIGAILARADAFVWYKIVLRNLVQDQTLFATVEWPEVGKHSIRL